MIRVIPITLLIFLTLSGFAQDDPGIITELSCETCHTGGDWLNDAGTGFDHLSTGFQLEGTHSNLACTMCHQGSTPLEKHNFSGVSSECSSCHIDIHQDQWGQDCQRCHTPDSWSLSTEQQNHDLTRFPLQGPHRSLNCESCHVNTPGNSATLPVDCWGCHESDFANSIQPNHQTLDLDKDCELCHSAQSSQWTTNLFDHSSTNFALLGMHAQASCETCHEGPVQNTPTRCESCHISDYNSSQDPAHLADGYPQDCRDCHDSFTWNSNFTHDQTGFTLFGAHVETSCNECHVNQDFDDTPETCGICHATDWETSEIPPHEAAEFDKDCEACHTEESWTPSSWDHDTDTDYPLEGGHLEVSCETCHTVIPYSEQGTDCYVCHQIDYEATLDPNHVSAGIPMTCEVCHTTDNWESMGIDHSQTQFPLVGAHAELLCETCHSDGYDLPILCEGCHLPDYQGTSVGLGPNHEAFSFSQDCLACHGQVSWTPSFFDHNPNVTGYAIEGAHQELLPDDCYACHENAQWTGISTLCEDCHQTAFNNTNNPDHIANGFPENLCATCHAPAGWTPAIFEHSATTTDCATCHLIQYNGTNNPSHSDAGFNTECQSCHTPASWSNSTWQHGVETDFNVLGAHTELNCVSCHVTTPYNSLDGECGACHQSNFDLTSDPDHTAYGYPVTLCQSCHSQTAWEPAIFSHESTSDNCVTCHLVQYTETVDPPHESLAYTTDCQICHSTESWTPSTFIHNIETTGFLKDGAHDVIGCNSCHETWEPPSEVRTCASIGCHIEDFQSSTNPPHELMSFSQNCVDCHTTTAWLPSQFEHDLVNTGFLLEEAHISAECQQCHTPWQVNPAPRSCADGSCHLSDYETATDPNHLSDSYPLECETCHSMTAWESSTFDHDGQYFPINSGQHRGEWSDCSQCHINSNDFADFTCFGAGCHSVSEENSNHCDGADCESCNGNTYPISGVTPQDCLTCHPTGDEDDCGGDLLNFFKLKIMPQPSQRGPDETN